MRRIENISKIIIVCIICCLPMMAMGQSRLKGPHRKAQQVMTDSLVQQAATEAVAVVDSLSPDDVLLGEMMKTDALTKDDSLSLVSLSKSMKKEEKKRKRRNWATWKPEAKRAMWLALVLPGAGQIYNRKYWKLPILYGGFLGCAYAMRWNNQMYMDYSQAYLDIMDDDPSTQSYNQFLHLGKQINADNMEHYKTVFKARKDQYRRWRDMSFFVMLGVYALSIIDAYVDASLSQFDISDDLSLRVGPAVINSSSKSISINSPNGRSIISNAAVGVNGALTF